MGFQSDAKFVPWTTKAAAEMKVAQGRTLLILASLGVAAAVAGTARAEVGPQPCQALRTLSLPGVAALDARWMKPGSPAFPTDTPKVSSSALPAHCLVTGLIDPRTGVDGQAYGTRFELRLPDAWSRRFLFQGGAGLDGVVRPALGDVSSEGAPALARGYAVVSMDAGHEGQDASFAADQQARLDYAYQALAKTTPVAKALVAAYYGSAPTRSYFVGCSNGGRQAMLAAQREPLQFDGIAAGDPGFRLSRAAVAEAWNTQKLSAIAPRGPDGAPRLAEALSPADLQLVSEAVLRACDSLDGLKDGMINNVRACRFTPARLRCSTAKASGCLSPAKLDALRAVFAGPVDRHGDKLYPGFPYDAGISAPGWRLWMLGAPGGMAAINATLGADALSRYFMTPPEPGRPATAFDFDHAAEAVAQTGALNDATSTFLTSFRAHGGKLIIYQGVSDPVFSATDIENWYNQLAASDPHTSSYARLFAVPGMNHCGGGPATDRFDVLAALQAWVEQGRAPDRIRATGATFPGLSRPLCPYPRYARYEGGDPNNAESFSCKIG